MKRWRTDVSRWRAAATALVFLLAAGAALAEAPSGLEPHPPGSKFADISGYLRNEVATGKIPGAIMLIQQHGAPVYSESFGVRDMVSKQPMTENTIFRLYSMSKPITSVAVMMLVEDGRLSLD